MLKQWGFREVWRLTQQGHSASELQSLQHWNVNRSSIGRFNTQTSRKKKEPQGKIVWTNWEDERAGLHLCVSAAPNWWPCTTVRSLAHPSCQSPIHSVFNQTNDKAVLMTEREESDLKSSEHSLMNAPTDTVSSALVRLNRPTWKSLPLA